MKELTIEEKAKRYDEALGRAKEIHAEERAQPFDVMLKVFPELKESEDERIRKSLINYVYCHGDAGDFTKKEFIAWLEKQGEQKPIDPDTLIQQRVDALADIVAEQKSTDKVEPKFKVGDWLINRHDNIRQVIDIKDGLYYCIRLECCDTKNTPLSWAFEYVDGNWRKWTIQDAKAGDVLSDETTIFIFKDLLSDGSVMSYCNYDADSGESDAFCPLSMNLMCSKITPATKEQRDTLFTKMKEAGYVWNAEKKELKKTEEEFNGGDYGVDSLWHARNILERTLGKVEGYQTDDGILEHKCAISAVKKLYEQKPAWSEEDKYNYNNILSLLNNEFVGRADKRIAIEWLKFLKDRYTWKPSDEQMDALRYVTNFDYGGYKATLVSLYEQLKKLRGE